MTQTTYTQKGSVTVQAFQWNNQAFTAIAAAFAKGLFLQAVDSNLHVTTRSGTECAHPTDWVVQDPDGSINIIPNASFVKLYS